MVSARHGLASALLGFAALSFGTVTDATAASDYPSKPVRIVVSYPAGGTTDILARLVAEGLRKKFGQPFVVENRAGAATAIAAQAVTRSAPDGYTLLVSTGSTTAFAPLLYANPGYKAEQLTGVAMIGRAPLVFDVPPQSPFNSVADVVAHAKANPGKLNLATQGAGATSHLTAELFRASAGIDFVPVHYAGSTPGLIATMGGQVDLYFDGVATSTPQFAAKKIKMLAVTSDKRLPTLPDVPTMIEAGFPEVVVYSWYGLLAPTGTPKEILDLLNKEVNAIVESKDVQERLAKDGAEPTPMSIAAFEAFYAEEREMWRKVIIPLNIKLD